MLKASISCPKCGKNLSIPLAQMVPSNSYLCTNCGEVITFVVQGASMVEEIVNQVGSKSSGVSVEVKVETRQPRRNVLTIGVLLLAFGALVLAMVDRGVPERSRLTEVSGHLRSLEKVTSKGGGLSAVRFSLSTDSRDFHYISKAGHIGDVWSALGQAGRSEVCVLIDPADSHSPPFGDRTFYMVYEVKIGRDTIRPYAEVAEAWNADNSFGLGLGYGSAIAGIALLVMHFWKQRQRAPSAVG